MKQELPEGTVVKIGHGRRVDGQVGYWYRTTGKDGHLRSWKENGYQPSPRGGRTGCTVILPNGDKVIGEAECSHRDNYSKKLGRDIALGRALKRAVKMYPNMFETKEKVT